jgi:glycosyltransferase involved in cell wall biosynthesis
MVSLSICIPVHDPEGTYSNFLIQLLNSIGNQTDLPDEIVLSASHEIKYLSDLQDFSKNKFDLVFFKNQTSGSAENTNFAVSKARGEIVKLMHQDDYLSNNFALENIKASLGNHAWQASAFDHLAADGKSICNPKIPKISRRMLSGHNFVGAPSVVAFQKKCFIPFDERMHYMFDCDWYLKMWHNWGKPSILKDNSITIRVHPGQATNWAYKLFKREVEMTKDNHQKKLMFPLFKCTCRIG